MSEEIDPADNYESTKRLIGYIPRNEATRETYAQLGFKCGLEIHQQLLTKSKLFCRCPTGIYQADGEYDAEVIRHMRPTLSEMGEYDGTALMERKTKKNIIYRIKNETACTYDIDDTPPFPLDRESLAIATEIALMLNLNIVGELHITRKQYLDGSIPTGFQRTAIVGIEGEIPLSDKKVRIIQLSVEEDACREVSDEGHWRVYTTDRLGMPLIETVTYPDMLTPDEAAEAGHFLRFVARSSGKVRTGIGAAREDVNVSITGGTRVEIKGVAHIRWIPELTHNEAFRQKALLQIRKDLNERVSDAERWRLAHADLDYNSLDEDYPALQAARRNKHRLTAVNLPQFAGMLSFFTQPGQTFADELSGRIKVIACLERPNLLHSEQSEPVLTPPEWAAVRERLAASPGDSQLVIWGPNDDVDTAIETIQERCLMAFQGIPNETRKALKDGTTVFERVLPGPDRMYPDTDSAPIPIEEEFIEEQRAKLPPPVSRRLSQLAKWQVPPDTYRYLLRRNLVGLIETIVADLDAQPRFVATLLGHTFRRIEGTLAPSPDFDYARIYDLFAFVRERGLDREIIRKMLPVVYQHPKMVMESVLTTIGFKPRSREEILSYIPTLHEEFSQICTSKDSGARSRWIMGNLRKLALGSMSLARLRTYVEKEVVHG